MIFSNDRTATDQATVWAIQCNLLLLFVTLPLSSIQLTNCLLQCQWKCPPKVQIYMKRGRCCKDCRAQYGNYPDGYSGIPYNQWQRKQ